MKVLVINAGSSSLKYQLIDTDTQQVHARGRCERIGIDNGLLVHAEMGGSIQQESVDFADHTHAIHAVFRILKTCHKHIDAIGHRVVQGGWYFPDCARVTDETLGWVREVAPLAPLHNYAQAEVIEICRDMYPDLENIIVPDTAFHYDMPKIASTYPIPKEVRERYHIRKYGAHGISHHYISNQVNAFSEGRVHKLVSCHIGSGASLAAIKDGHVQDTTMGLTPLDGLIMGTRVGAIDPAVVFYLNRQAGYSIDEIDDMMNKESGLKALSGEGYSDLRDIEAGMLAGDERCQFAFDMYIYRISQLVMSMAGAMEGVDAIAFSAGVGEHSHLVRQYVCKRLEWIGVKLDEVRNLVDNDGTRLISSADSKVQVLVVPTNEELMIAIDVAHLLQGKPTFDA